MFELVQAGERTWYINNRNYIGIYQLNDEEVCLIDTGKEQSEAEQIQEILETQGWKLSFIINTHTHIDHLGGNAYLMEKWGCPAYATNIDNAFANYKHLEAAYMYGGDPFRELRHIFLHPGPIGFRDIEDFKLPEGLEYVRLPGHTFGMIGIKTSDDVWFIADSVLNSRCLEKYQFGYLVDVEGYLDTLTMLQTLDGKLFVPGHGDVTEDIVPLAQGNQENIRKNIDAILEDCKGGKNFDLILKDIFERYRIKGNPAQYVLVGSTLRCYLTYLQDRGKLECFFEDNILKWKTVI